MSRPAFTKRHFEAIAEILSEHPGEYIPFEMIVDQFCDLFADVNANFDREKFRKACGLEIVNAE